MARRPSPSSDGRRGVQYRSASPGSRSRTKPPSSAYDQPAGGGGRPCHTARARPRGHETASAQKRDEMAPATRPTQAGRRSPPGPQKAPAEADARIAQGKKGAGAGGQAALKGGPAQKAEDGRPGSGGEGRSGGPLDQKALFGRGGGGRFTCHASANNGVVRGGGITPGRGGAEAPATPRRTTGTARRRRRRPWCGRPPNRP